LEKGTYYIWTIGCQMNEADSRHLAARLEGLGYCACDRAEEAEVTVLNTCVVRQQPEDKAVSRLLNLKPFKRRHPEKVVALMGCMVGQREAEGLRERFPFVDVFLEPSATDPLIEFLCARKGIDFEAVQARQELLHDYNLPAPQEGAVTAFVPVTLGCSHACSYCVIPYRRGPDRSRPPEKILAEVRALAEQGVKEVALLGQIVDRYGMDLDGDRDLAWLLQQTVTVEGLERVRFLTSHPAYMDDRLIEVVAGMPKLMPHFELPFQSGNNRILEAMRRGYTREDYLRLVDRIRSRIPDAAINTDIIVGYPSETEAEFMDTLRLCEEVRPDIAHIAKYSPRPRTASARQPDDVPAEEKERRRLSLDECMKGIMTAKNQRLTGTEVEVMAERFDVKKGNWRGRTPQNKLVFFKSDWDCKGQIVQVRIDWTGPYSMLGQVVAWSEIVRESG